MEKSSFRFYAILCVIIFIAAILYESVNQTGLQEREFHFLSDSANDQQANETNLRQSEFFKGLPVKIAKTAGSSV